MARKNESIFHFVDFRGGYFTDVPSAQLQAGEMLTAQNCFWDGGLKKRAGYDYLLTVTASGILGGIKTVFHDVSQYIVATKHATTSGPSFYSEFHIGTVGAALTTLTGMASVNCTTGDGSADVQFAALGQLVVCANGVDKPKIIFEDAGSYYIDTVEHYDERTRDDANWVAGQFDGTSVTDDTTDAQDTGAGDFVLFGTTISTGFVVGCDFTFNRVNITTSDTAVATATMTYEFYGRATAGAAMSWVAFTPEELPTWSSAGNHGLQWAFPIGYDGSILMEKLTTSASWLDGKYAMRGYLNATVTASAACTSLTVKHNQYLSQLFVGDTPDTVVEHKNHLFLGAGNWARISPANSLKGWRYQDYEYFHQGGDIKKMVSHRDRLVVLLDGWMYGITGNSWSNWALQDIGPYGCAAKYGAVNGQGDIYFIGTDGFIKKYDGNSVIIISKHINTDISTATKANLRFEASDRKVWIGDPGNQVAYVFDPDTFRTDPMGDGRVSFYKWTNYPLDYWLRDKAADELFFLAVETDGSCHLYTTAGSTAYDETYATATVPITWTMLLPYSDYGAPLQKKSVRRLKLSVDDVTSSSYGTATISFFMKNGNGLSSYSVAMEVPSGTGIHEGDYTPQYTMDGPEIGVQVRHDKQVAFKLYGLALEVRRKVF